MSSLVFMYLAFYFFTPSVIGLHCGHRKEIIHAFSRSVSGQEVKCSEPDSYCLRMESTGTLFGFPGEF